MALFTQIFLHKRAPLKPHLRQTLSTSLDFPPVQFTPGARTYSHCLPWHLWTPSSISSTPGGRWRPAGPLRLPWPGNALGAVAGLPPLRAPVLGHHPPRVLRLSFHISRSSSGCLMWRVSLVPVALFWVKVEASTISF